jgi:GGDEF domain-containing protein
MATGSGLARAFYRLFILYALDEAPRRPASILAALHASEGALPVESGAFSKAVAQLIDAGLVRPGALGELELTPLGRREREAQRIVWQRLLEVVGRLLSGVVPPPEPPEDGGASLPVVGHRVAEEHRERVVLAEIRELARRARDDGATFAVVLADIAIAHPRPSTQTAMLQRALRETLGRAKSTFAVGASAHRYGERGMCLVVSGDDHATQAELLRARLLESLGAMRATVKAFGGARYAVRIGAACWTAASPTSTALLRAAEAALCADAAARAA